MSGPKVIDYQAVARQRAEAARRRRLALCGRAEAFRQRCVAAGYPECAVGIQSAGSSTADIEQDCLQLERSLSEAADQLARRQFAARTRDVAAGMHDILADLERREQRTATDTTTPNRQRRSRPQPDPATTSDARIDYADKVSRQLASLETPSRAFDDAAQALLTESDPSRARLMFDDLRRRISQANQQAQRTVRQQTEIAELRAQLSAVRDPQPLLALLDQADAAVGRGDDIDVALRQARGAITAQLDAAAATADRIYVRGAIAEALGELGYTVADVDVATPETLVFRQNSTHGVRADVRDGRIDVRAVRLGSASTSTADRDAEEQFCQRIPGFLAALGSRGVSAGVKESKLPGLFAPETVPLRARPGAPAADGEQQRTHTRRRPR